MKDIEILKNSIDILGMINIPMSLFETVGAPIFRVRSDLKALYDAVIEKQNAKMAAAEQKPEELPAEEVSQENAE